MTSVDTANDVEQLAQLARAVSELRKQVAQRIVGQDQVVDRVLTALLAGGHSLLIGVPGLAKTLLVSTIAEALELSFNRVQFTPDLMPGDITGTELVEEEDRKSTRLNSSHSQISYAVFCLKKKTNRQDHTRKA